MGQEEKLVKVNMEQDMVHPPAASPSKHHVSFKCMIALLAVMGVALVGLGLILHYSFFNLQCSQVRHMSYH